MFLKEKDHSSRYTLLKLIGTALVALMLIAGVRTYDRASAERGQKIVNDSVTRAAAQCYALEGRYPTDLAYLRNHYGLSANEEKYAIHYVYNGDNILPDITVTVRALP